MSRKIFKVLFFFLIGIALLEGSLRLGGVVYNQYQNFNSTPVKADSERTLTFLTLGESTTAGKSNWPGLTQDILNNRFEEVEFIFINKAINSTKSGILLSKVEEQIEEYEPDAVISMMGINDKYFEDSFSKYKYIGKKNDSFIDRSLNFLRENLRIFKFANLVKDPFLREDKGGHLPEAKKGKGGYIKAYAPDNDPEKGVEKYERILEEDPFNVEAWIILGWLVAPPDPSHGDPEKVKKATNCFEKALEIDPSNYSAYYSLMSLNLYDRDSEKAVSLAEQALEHYPNDEFFYSYLLNRLAKMPDLDIDKKKEFLKKYSGKDFIYHDGEVKNVTAHHYNKLYEILDEHDISLIAMQYPRRNIGELRSYFNKDRREDIIFISNKENFEKALQKNDYNDIFNDKCYGDFGHATRKGRGIIAENVASTIEENFDVE